MSITYISVSNFLFFALSSFTLRFTFHLLSIRRPLSRESQVLLQGEEEEEEEKGAYQCESDPSAIHHLPLLSGSLRKHRSQDGLQALCLGCVTVEPTVCFCFTIFAPDELLVSTLLKVFFSLFCRFNNFFYILHKTFLHFFEASILRRQVYSNLSKTYRRVWFI